LVVLDKIEEVRKTVCVCVCATVHVFVGLLRNAEHQTTLGQILMLASLLD